MPPARTPGRRLLFIGLDAADCELVERWSADGTLPNIAAMRSRGSWSRLRTTADVLHVSGWPGVFTGAPPDHHGLYHAYVMQPGEQAPARPRPADSPVPFLWKTLDEQGIRCIVMDAFLTCPLKPFGGTQVVDWGSWTHFVPTTIAPDDVRRELKRKFGDYPAEDHSRVGMTPPPDPTGFRDRLLAAARRKVEVVKWLMAREDWELLLVVFGESHPAGHYFWHYQDPDYAAYPADCDPALRTALRDVYVALDEAIGELCAAAGDDTTVFVVSADGMGPNYSASHLLNDLLGRMSLLAGPTAADGGATSGARPPARRSLLSRLRGMIPRELRAAVSRHLLPRTVNERLSLHWKTAGIDWGRTRAFTIENANEGYLRLNLRGREPQGVVAPGEEYAALCSRLAEVARSLRNPANGRPAACAVHRTDELFAGPCRPMLPDVIINWDPDARVTTEVEAQGVGVIRSPQAGHAVSPFYTGNHRPSAFLAAAGPGIPAGASLDAAGIMDLAPTILAHFGLKAPPSMQGTVLEFGAGTSAAGE